MWRQALSAFFELPSSQRTFAQHRLLASMLYDPANNGRAFTTSVKQQIEQAATWRAAATVATKSQLFPFALTSILRNCQNSGSWEAGAVVLGRCFHEHRYALREQHVSHQAVCHSKFHPEALGAMIQYASMLDELGVAASTGSSTNTTKTASSSPPPASSTLAMSQSTVLSCIARGMQLQLQPQQRSHFQQEDQHDGDMTPTWMRALSFAHRWPGLLAVDLNRILLATLSLQREEENHRIKQVNWKEAIELFLSKAEGNNVRDAIRNSSNNHRNTRKGVNDATFEIICGAISRCGATSAQRDEMVRGTLSLYTDVMKTTAVPSALVYNAQLAAGSWQLCLELLNAARRSSASIVNDSRCLATDTPKHYAAAFRLRTYEEEEQHQEGNNNNWVSGLKVWASMRSSFVDHHKISSADRQTEACQQHLKDVDACMFRLLKHLVACSSASTSPSTLVPPSLVLSVIDTSGFVPKAGEVIDKRARDVKDIERKFLVMLLSSPF